MMESTKFKMTVFVEEHPVQISNKNYNHIKRIITDMEPSDIRDIWWINNMMVDLIIYRRHIEIEGTSEQFGELIKYSVTVKGMFELSEHLFVM